MRKITLALAAAASLGFASAANATVTIGTVGTDVGSNFAIDTNNTAIPNTVTFSTTTNNTGNVTSYFEFQESFASIGNFSVTTSAIGGTLTLEQLLTGGGATIIKSVTGSTFSLNLLTGPLAAGTLYRFSYTANLPSGGGAVSGNANFIPAVPEPATWAMLLLGFGAMGFVMRRRARPAITQVA